LPPETHICLVTDTANYERMRIGSGDFLVPRESVLRTLQTDSGVTEATIAYSSCREYTSESTIHFSGTEPRPNTAGASNSASSPSPLPAGLAFSVVLANPIDTSIAAAGDVFLARIRLPAVDQTSNAVLIPAGATIRGRIVRMEHFPGTRFVIAIQLEALEVGGIATPFYAKPKDTRVSRNQTERTYLSRPGVHIVLPQLMELGNAASFVFPRSKEHYVVPAGYESSWITLPPPATP